MITTIDSAGRVVIPKQIRERLSLSGGERVEVREAHGEITLSRLKPGVKLVRTAHGNLTASPDSELPGLGPEGVRELLERTRR